MQNHQKSWKGLPLSQLNMPFQAFPCASLGCSIFYLPTHNTSTENQYCVCLFVRMAPTKSMMDPPLANACKGKEIWKQGRSLLLLHGPWQRNRSVEATHSHSDGMNLCIHSSDEELLSPEGPGGGSDTVHHRFFYRYRSRASGTPLV